MMKSAVVMFILLLLCGCSTFGTFASLKQGDTTSDEVRTMLGEPVNRVFQAGGEVWEYQFVKEDRERAQQQTIMNLSVTFKENVVDNYNVTISKRSMPQRDQGPERGAIQPSEQPGRQPSGQSGQQPPGQSGRQPSGQSERQPSGQSERQPSGQSERQPSGQSGQSADRKDFISELDKNSDQRVSRDEFPGPDQAFEQFDRNGDGYIDKDEAPSPSSNQQRQGGRMQR